MAPRLIAIVLVLVLGACQRNASDQPTPTATPATPPPATAPAAPEAPAAPPTADNANSGTGTATGAIGTATDAGPVSVDGAATGSTGAMPTGQSDAALEADLRRCNTLAALDQATCRSDAESRFEQRAASGAPEPPANRP